MPNPRAAELRVKLSLTAFHSHSPKWEKKRRGCSFCFPNNNFKKGDMCMKPVYSVIWSAKLNWHMCSPKLWFKLESIYASKANLDIFSDSWGMKVPVDNAILYRYINKAFNSFRLLEKSHLNIFPWRNLSMITCEGSTDFSVEVSVFTQGRIYVPVLLWQDLSVFLKYHFHRLSHDVNIHEQRSWGWCSQNEKNKQVLVNCQWKYHCISILLKQAIIWWVWRLM